MADEEVVSQQVDDGKQVEETNNNTNEEVKEEPSAAIAPDVDSAAVDGEMECDEDCDSDNLVPESAFWHVEASLDNGFEMGMRVEIEHEPQKYWPATVVNVFGHMLSLRWDGSQETIFLDITKKRCYPLGYFKSKEECNLESLTKLKLSEKVVCDITKKYAKETEVESKYPLALFSRGGYSVDLFSEAVVLEVAHESDPTKHWFAEIVRNVGGRLRLKWKLGTSSPEDPNQSEFWIYFCHPRIHLIGAASAAGNICYEPPVLYESWAGDIETFLNLGKEDNTEASKDSDNLRKLLLQSAKSKKPELFESESIRNVKKDEKVLIFPSSLLKLLPATIKQQLNEESFKISATHEESEISFCYPLQDSHAMLPFSWSDANDIPINFGPELHDSNTYFKSTGSKAASIVLKPSYLVDEFKMNGKVEVVHPDQPDTICEAVIIRVTPPLIWVQLSTESICTLPFNSSELFPSGWCQNHDYPLTKLLPARHLVSKVEPNATPVSAEVTDAKAAESSTPGQETSGNIPSALMPAGSKAWCPRIYFNHKCFTGPSLSKSKICELPRFVGPGPVLLVMQEVISKIISVAYVPSRILNELSSKAFNQMLKSEKIRKTESVVFKAKYQKRSYRDQINVIRSAEQVEEFCRCVCSHLKCCYNLFGPKLYDGDHCPSNCRGLTKSNKVLKRATYYREKAAEEKTKEPTGEDQDKKVSLIATGKDAKAAKRPPSSASDEEKPTKKRKGRPPLSAKELADRAEARRRASVEAEKVQASIKENKQKKVESKRIREQKKNERPLRETVPFDNPLNWSIGDVQRFLTKSRLAVFASTLREHEIDGPALMLLDYETIRTNLFSGYTRKFTLEDIAKLSNIINRVKSSWCRNMRFGARGSELRQQQQN